MGLIITVIVFTFLAGAAIGIGFMWRYIQSIENDLYAKAEETAKKNFDIGWTHGIGYVLSLGGGDPGGEALDVYLHKAEAYKAEGVGGDWNIGGVVEKKSA
jgi:hypothetical protein